VKRLVVPAPAAVPPPPRALGRLGPALAWLAAAQGAWPPVAPSNVRRVVAEDGSTRAEGQAEADRLVDGGGDLFVLGSAGDQVAGLVVLAALLDLEPVQAVGTATGPGWAAQVTGVRDGLRAARVQLGDPVALLTGLGSAPLAVLTGALAQAAVRRTPVLLDGSAVTAAAAVLADRLAPGAARWFLAGQVPPSPAARKGLAAIGLTGLLDLGLSLPLGADLAADLLTSAVSLVDPGSHDPGSHDVGS